LDKGILRDYRDALEARGGLQIPNLIHELRGDSVNDEKGVVDANVERLDQIANPFGSHYALGGRICHDEEYIDVAGCPSTEVLQPSFGIDDHHWVSVSKLVHNFSEEVVDITVAARAFGAAHDEKIEAIELLDCALKKVVEIFLFCLVGAKLVLIL
jgi:hypothetical protein